MFLVDDFGAWLTALLADAGRKRLTSFILGSDEERALRRAASAAVQLAATELCPADNWRAEYLATVIDEIFADRVSNISTVGQGTILESLQAEISEALAPLGDREITETGRSFAQIFSISIETLTERLTTLLLQEILSLGVHGGPLAALANQLNHDATHVQGQRVEETVKRLASVIEQALERLDEADESRVVPALASGMFSQPGHANRKYSPLSLSTFRPIETMLRRELILEPEFGRVNGSFWVDFDEGYHPFTSAQAAFVANNLQSQRFHLVLGSSGAWREQFTRYVGWRLASGRFRVLYADCTSLPSNITSEQMAVLDSSDTCLIIDNAHANSSLCEDFLTALQDVTSSLRCIFSADPCINSTIIYKPYFRSDLVTLPTTTLNSGDEAVRLVNRYAEKKLNRRIGPALARNFIDASRVRKSFGLFYVDDDDVEYNLWLLLVLLRGWNGRTVPGLDQLSSSTRNFIDDAVVEPLLSHGVPVASLATVVAHFHYLGVGAPIEFLCQVLAFSSEDIAAAQRLGVVKQVKRVLWLGDDHLPYPLQEAGVHRHEIYADIARRLAIDELDADLFHSLENAFIMNGYPGYDLVLLNGQSLSRAETPSLLWEYREIDLSSLRRLLQGERSPAVLGRALVAVSQRYAHPAPLLALEFKLSVLVKVIDTARSARSVAWLIEGLNKTMPSFAQELAIACDASSLASILRAERNLGSSASLLWALRNADVQRAAQVASLLTNDEWKLRAAQEKQGARLGWFLFILSDISAPRAELIASAIGAEPFAEAVRSNPTCRDVAALFWGLTNASPPLASALARIVSRSMLRDCLIYESELMFSGMLLRSLAAADRQVAAAVLRRVDLQALTSRVTDYEDETAAALFLSALSAAVPRRAAPIIRGIQRSLRAEEMSAAMAHQMFSTMNPTAMAMAGRRRDRAARRLAAIDGYQATDALGPLTPSVSRSQLSAAALWTLWTYNKDSCISLIRNNWQIIQELFDASQSILARAELAIPLFASDPQRFATFMKTVGPSSLIETDISQIEAALALRPRPHPDPMAMLLATYTCTEARATRIVSTVEYRKLESAVVELEPFAPELARTLMYHINLDDLLSADYRSSRDDAINFMVRIRPEYAPEIVRRISSSSREENTANSGCQGLKRFIDVAWKIKFQAPELTQVAWAQNKCSEVLQECADLSMITEAIRWLRLNDLADAKAAASSAGYELVLRWLRADDIDENLPDCISEISEADLTVGLRLVPHICEKMIAIPEFGMEILAALSPIKELARQIINQLAPPSLAQMVSWDSSIATVANGLEMISKLAPSTGRLVAVDLMQEFLPVSLPGLSNVDIISRFLDVLSKIDRSIARDAVSLISPRNLVLGLRQGGPLAPEKILPVVASLNMKLAEAVASDIVGTYINSGTAQSLDFYYAAEILDAIAKVDLRLLEVYVTRIDAVTVANVFQEQASVRGWVSGEDSFLRLIVAGDPAKAEQLHLLAPETITEEKLNNAALDSRGVEWADIEINH